MEDMLLPLRIPVTMRCLRFMDRCTVAQHNTRKSEKGGSGTGGAIVSLVYPCSEVPPRQLSL